MNEEMQESKVIVIDGAEVSEEELKEKQNNPNIRLFQESPNHYRVLTRLTE